MKKLSWTILIVALVVTIFLIAVEAYYVAVALVVGTLIMSHRELWSLIRKRKLPPVDERVKENTAKAVRNGFIFFAAATAILMLPFTVILTEGPDTVQVLAALFLSAGLVYLLSYLFYDRAEPKMTEKRLKLLKKFFWVVGMSVGAFIISVFLHNALSGLFGVEEPVFFIIAVILAPLALVVGLIGSLVLFIIGLVGNSS
ncbi:MAG: hypothetical protein KAW90_01480 [Dehalococcoidales bacterium]|nr:hypothetical protein [Dehalococcoidales bacterium]